MFDTIYPQIGAGIAILVILFVFLKGDEPERIGGAAFVLTSLASMLISDGKGLGVVQWARMGIDLILLAVFVGLAWKSRRAWPVWASAFLSLIVTGHILLLANLKPPADAFAAVNNLATYGVLGALAVGTFWAWQDRRAAGLER